MKRNDCEDVVKEEVLDVVRDMIKHTESNLASAERDLEEAKTRVEAIKIGLVEFQRYLRKLERMKGPVEFINEKVRKLEAELAELHQRKNALLERRGKLQAELDAKLAESEPSLCIREADTEG